MIMNKYFRRKISKRFIIVSCIIFIIVFIMLKYKLHTIHENKLKMLRATKSLYPGEMGTPVKLPLYIGKRELELIDHGWKTHQFNVYISDMIPLSRSLPNIQDEWCKQPGLYLKQLPVTDVIICFHNEPKSTLLRTLHSVINRSPEHLIGQIIVVDDYSDMDELEDLSSEYIFQLDKVKLIRTLKREGLHRARLLAMNYSTASVLTFIDSHCECTDGWLEPLLDRIARNFSTVVTPYIDNINGNTFEYVATDLRNGTLLGGFNWSLEYTTFYPSQKRKNLYKHYLEPHDTPTISGTVFSINREYFENLGTYDWGFDNGTTDNLELSFKTWMCGGKLEIVYCSRVGKVLRTESKNPSTAKAAIKNRVRLAEVWLDDYAKFYYESMGLAFNTIEFSTDVKDRKKLRKNLKCKNFGWYLENIYTEKLVPLVVGAMAQIETNMCIDAEDKEGNVKVLPCHAHGGNQFWMFTNLHEFRKEEMCLTANDTKPILQKCQDDNESSHWLHDEWTHSIFNNATKQCLSLSVDHKNLLLEKCHRNSWRQHWALY